MDRSQLYKEHLDEMFGIIPIDELTEEDVNRIIARLLSFLPNNGKLYKYRSIEGDAFNNAYEGLEQGYIYMARANTLNDDLDSSLHFDVEKDVQKQMDLFMDKPWLFLDNWVNTNLDQLGFKSPVDIWAYKTVMSCVDKTTYDIDKEKAVELFVKSGVRKKTAKKYIKDCLDLVNKTIEEHAEELKKPISDLVNFNEISKKDIYVFSLTEDYDSNTMWAYYANSNKGFCIEYDYNKIQTLPIGKKKLLINIYQVIYKDEFEEYSFVDMQKYFMTGAQDKELLKKAGRDILEKTITKLSKWKEEKEWRIFLCNLDENNKIYADIVSGIIIDERIINCDNSKRLIDLAKNRKWNIKARKKNRLGTSHIYEELK